MQALEGIEVLQLGLGTQLGHRHGDEDSRCRRGASSLCSMEQSEMPRVAKIATELFHKQACFLGRAQVGFGHQLDQRRAAAVVIDERLSGSGNAAFGTTHVHHLGGVLFHMNAKNTGWARYPGTIGTALGHLHVGGIVARQMAGALIAPHASPVVKDVEQALGIGGGRSEALGLGGTKCAIGALGSASTSHIQIQYDRALAKATGPCVWSGSSWPYRDSRVMLAIERRSASGSRSLWRSPALTMLSIAFVF